MFLIVCLETEHYGMSMLSLLIVLMEIYGGLEKDLCLWDFTTDLHVKAYIFSLKICGGPEKDH